ncbi:MAG: outer membrane protein assembly factor BamC [Gammaproteobacteria bacterium]|nr:outer membrane protein assembly factor BamC [Gammaproteobacteria bacterium]
MSLRVSTVLLSLSLLSGCAINMVGNLFVAEKDNYLAAKTVDELKVPQDLDTSRIQDAWVIPEIPEQPAARVYPSGAPKPATIVGENDPNTIRIKRLGERRWMVLQRKPETVWPLVRQFFRQYGLVVEVERPEQGEIVTGPLDLSGDTLDPDFVALVGEHLPTADNGDYLVFRIEQGIKRGTSEIHMRYLKEDQQESSEMWLEGNSERGELEGKLLTAVAEFDVSALSEQTVSSIGRQIATEPKASLVRNDAGHPILLINVDFDRAWATVSRALESAEIEVTNTDREAQSFQIVLPSLDAESQMRKRGFLGIMFGGRDRNKAGAQEALVRIDGEESVFKVLVTSTDGEFVETDYAEQFLAMLREHAA